MCLKCFADKLASETPKMTSSASQPDLLSGWENWSTGGTSTTTNTTTAASKPTVNGNQSVIQTKLLLG